MPPIDPGLDRLLATGLVCVFLRHTLGDPPLAGASERNVVQIADPGAAAEEPGERPQPDQPQPPRRIRGADRPRPRDRRPRTAPASSPPTSRRCAAPTPTERYFFGAAYFDRILESDRAWLALAHAPDGGIAAASIAVEQRRLPPLLPQRQRRLPPARLADEERRRGPGRARRRARAAAQPRRRHRPRRPRSRSSSAASPTASSPGTPRRSSATPSAYAPPPPVGRDTAGFFPAYRRAVGLRSLARLCRVRPEWGRLKAEGVDRLAAVFAPGRLAEGADRVDR